ncbi:MAG TPA: hypothetical protein VKK61_09335 [Tepidisphaeraceae bacterium]|nr:hypothetical protein [Tepidisphaeraceae bacterium]
MHEAITRELKNFAVETISTRAAPIHGMIHPFNQREVLRHLSPTATRLNSGDDLIELYQHDERFWLIDDHWGICEINLLKSRWRSWILPDARADATEIFERSMLWPIVQLLRPRGLSIIPAAAVTRDNWGVLILSSFNIEPELSMLVHAGFRVVGQRFAAIRDHAGHVEMLHMPGHVERMVRSTNGAATQRVDLTAELCGSGCEQAVCNAVMVVAPGRRPLSHLNRISPSNATGALRNAWPIVELHPQKRHGELPLRMAKRCRVFDVQLSRNPKDLLSLMEAARYERLPAKVA